MSPTDAIALIAPAFSAGSGNPASEARGQSNDLTGPNDLPGPNSLPGPDGLTGPNPTPGRWADLGCGSGVFTLALASLLPARSIVYAVDRRPGISARVTAGNVSIHPVRADFVRDPLPVQNLDGILMANSLHYVRDKPALIRRLRESTLRPDHQFLIVEYDTDRPTPIWVPHPLSFSSLRSLFHALGYHHITRLADRPSVYNRNPIYAARIV